MLCKDVECFIITKVKIIKGRTNFFNRFLFNDLKKKKYILAINVI